MEIEPTKDPFGRPIPDVWGYNAWPSGEPYKWEPAARGSSVFDSWDFHLDLGCGKLKKGRIGVDRYPADGVDLVFDMETMSYPHPTPADPPGIGQDYRVGHLPIPDSSIQSIVTHHFLEHLTPAALIHLMDEAYRVIVPDGLFRIIVPLFPSHAAMADPDHKSYFLEGTFESFCGTPDNCWLESFSVPYTKARFTMLDKDMTPRLPDPALHWTAQDAREIRVALQANK